MKIIKPSFEILTPINRHEILKHLETVARTCYKSEDKITEESAPKMVKSLIRSQHTAMIEHFSISVKMIVDRGVSHEIVRHRVASYAQESTRYCNYSQGKFGSEITVIEPLFFDKNSIEYSIWEDSCLQAEKAYNQLIHMGRTPQEARSVLPNSLKTEIVVTMNLREWIHFFNLRAIGTTGAPHPQMKEIAVMVLEKFSNELPEIFGDMYFDAC